jgi:broad specificity phosphatase PhoE
MLQKISMMLMLVFSKLAQSSIESETITVKYIRHGESKWNKAFILGDKALTKICQTLKTKKQVSTYFDAELTKEGIQQVKRSQSEFSEEDVNDALLFASPLRRATATIALATDESFRNSSTEKTTIYIHPTLWENGGDQDCNLIDGTRYEDYSGEEASDILIWEGKKYPRSQAEILDQYMFGLNLTKYQADTTKFAKRKALKKKKNHHGDDHHLDTFWHDVFELASEKSKTKVLIGGHSLNMKNHIAFHAFNSAEDKAKSSWANMAKKKMRNGDVITFQVTRNGSNFSFGQASHWTGSWNDSCTVVTDTATMLTANCKTRNKGSNISTLKATSCDVKRAKNIDGNLVCASGIY